MKIQFKTLIYIIILILLPLVAYKDIFDNYFMLDDMNWVGTPNRFVKHEINWLPNYEAYLKWAFFEQEGYTYRPVFKVYLLTLSFLFGLKFFYYNLFNFVIHVLNVLLIFILINLLTQKRFFSFLVAGLFSVNPAHHITVIHITLVYMLLATFFFLVSFIYFIKYIQKQKNYFYLLSFLFFLLALLSYEIAPPLIFIFYLYYILYNKESIQNYIQKYIIKPLIILAPFLLLVLSYLYIRIFIFPKPWVFGAKIYFISAHFILNYAIYVIHMFSPFLSSMGKIYPTLKINYNFVNGFFYSYFYDFFVLRFSLYKTALVEYILLGFVLIILMILFIKGKKLIKFFLGWMFIALLPLLFKSGYGGNYAYLSSVGACFLFVALIFFLYNQLGKISTNWIRKSAVLLFVLFISLIVSITLFNFVSESSAIEKTFHLAQQRGVRNTILNNFESGNISNNTIYFWNCEKVLPMVFLEGIFELELTNLNLTPKCLYKENKLKIMSRERGLMQLGEASPEEIEKIKYFYTWKRGPGEILILDDQDILINRSKEEFLLTL